MDWAKTKFCKTRSETFKFWDLVCLILEVWRYSSCSWRSTNMASGVTLPLENYLLTRQIWGIWKLRPACSSETPNLGQNRWCFVPCDLEICKMTLQNNRAPLLCYFKLCASFRYHWWIQTGVTVRNAQFGSNSTIFRAVWPWNLTYDL